MNEFRNKEVLAIIVAMPEEFNTIMSVVGKPKKISAQNREFFCAKNICVIQSSIGEIDASSATEALFWFVKEQGGEVAQILNVGVVGALRKSISIGQIFLTEKIVHYDFDIRAARENGRLGEYPDGQRFFAAETSLVEKLEGQVELATLASGDKFIADPTKICELVDQFDAHICDMEGAAVARVAARHQVPVTMIKTVSDNGDHDEYEENLMPAMDNLKEILKIILKDFSKAD